MRHFDLEVTAVTTYKFSVEAEDLDKAISNAVGYVVVYAHNLYEEHKVGEVQRIEIETRELKT